MELKEQGEIFNIFHDGSFTSFTKRENDIEFIIEIQYLAEILNPSFKHFKGVLKKCKKLEYEVWGMEPNVITDLEILNKLDLEISNSKIVEGDLKIGCYSSKENYSGNLVVLTDNILLFAENGCEISVAQLNEICQSYWNAEQ